MGNIIDEKLANKIPLIVDFGSDSCVPCKMIKPVLEEIADEYKGKVNVLILDVNQYQELAMEFGIMSIPTQIFYDKDGKIIGGHIGFIPKESFKDIIKEHFGIE